MCKCFFMKTSIISLVKKAVDLAVSRWGNLVKIVLNHGISESVVEIAYNELYH